MLLFFLIIRFVVHDGNTCCINVQTLGGDAGVQVDNSCDIYPVLFTPE